VRTHLLPCTRSGQAPAMQNSADWLPASKLEHVRLGAKERPQPGSRETKFVFVSCGPGSVGAKGSATNDDINW
jgi:hypothetical protein